MVMRTAHTANMQQPLKQMIIKIRRTPGYMAEDILPPGRLANFIEVIIALVGEVFLAKLDHALALPCAVARMASIMGS